MNARDLEMLDAWRHDRLSEAEFAVLQERLGKDAELRKALRALAEVKEGLSALATVRAQEQMTNTIEKVQPGSSRGAWLTWSIAALACVAAIVALLAALRLVIVTGRQKRLQSSALNRRFDLEAGQSNRKSRMSPFAIPSVNRVCSL